MTGISELAPDLAVGLLGGMALAALHLRLLWLATRRLGADGGLGVLLAGGALRLALLAAGFAAIGAAAGNPGLAMFAGLAAFTLFRMTALRVLGRGRDG